MLPSVAEQKESVKRNKQKRYLALCGCSVENHLPTELVRDIVKAIHRFRIADGRPAYAWPVRLTPAEAKERAQQVPYLRHLWAAKAMWGANATMGFVVEDGSTVHCSTVADMIKAGLISKKHAYLDQYIGTASLELYGERERDEATDGYRLVRRSPYQMNKN